MADIQAIQNWLQAHLPEYLDALQALVDVDCGTANKAGVDAVGALFRDRLRAAGFELTEFPLTDYGDCCLATVRGTGQARILLLGHLDTVYPDGTVAERPMRFDDGRILGPGVSDMKAGLLTGLYAVRALQHRRGRPGSGPGNPQDGGAFRGARHPGRTFGRHRKMAHGKDGGGELSG